MTFPVVLTVVLVGTDGATTIGAGDGTIVDAFDLSGIAEMSGTGQAEVSVPLSSLHAAELFRGRYIRVIATPDGASPVIIFSFKIEGDPELRYADPGEEHQMFLLVQGRGSGVMLEEPIVDVEQTESGELKDLDYGYRQFSFASYWYPNSGDWVAPTALYEYKDLTEATTRGRLQGVTDNMGTPDDVSDDVVNIYVAPIAFPWPNAYHNGDGAAPTPTYVGTYWIIAGDAPSETDVGYHFFRGAFDLDGLQEIAQFVTADNFFQLYNQRIPILGEKGDWYMWQGFKDHTMPLPEGFYVVGFVVENADVPGLTHPGGGLYNAVATSVYPGDVETSLTVSVLSSDDSAQWLSKWAAEDWPGWTPGQIMAQLLQEALTRGALPAYGGNEFGDFVDANLGPWDSVDPDTTIEFIPTFSVPLMTPYLQVLAQFVAEGWIDWYFVPTSNELAMWAQGTAGNTTDADFSFPGNIRSLVRGTSKPYTNALKVQFANGNDWVLDTDAIDDNGSRIEDGIFFDVPTIHEALRLGRVELQRRATAARPALLLEVEADIEDNCPFLGFGIGDYISVPNLANTGKVEQQVLSISFSTDVNGFAIWRMEVNARMRSAEREVYDVIRSIGGKSMGNVADHGTARA